MLGIRRFFNENVWEKVRDFRKFLNSGTKHASRCSLTPYTLKIKIHTKSPSNSSGSIGIIVTLSLASEASALSATNAQSPFDQLENKNFRI